MLTKDEKEVMNKLLEAWNLYVKLPIQHQDDQNEFRISFHRLQHLMSVRSVRREEMSVFVNYNKDNQ